MPGWNKASRQERGYGAAWDRLRAVVLRRDNHLCQPCLRTGRPTQATEVDHIKPKAEGGTNEADNLQAICSPCHAAKTKDEALRARGIKPRPVIGPDGWPVWKG